MTERANKLGNKPIHSEMYFRQNDEASEYCPFEVQTYSGLTKREYFAGLFMQALIANPERYKYIEHKMSLGDINQKGASAKNAHKAVLLADALLEELVKTDKNE